MYERLETSHRNELFNHDDERLEIAHQLTNCFRSECPPDGAHYCGNKPS